MIVAPPPLPMLITGIAGVPGYNAFHHFRSMYGDQVIGIRQSSMWPLKGDGIVACDVEDQQGLTRLWDEYRFASVLNCAGCCRLKSCELDPEMATRVNVVGAQNLMRLAQRHHARVIHLSIDLVFSGDTTTGRQGNYAEIDPPDPVTVYGAKMVEGESVVQRECPDACILRISLPMGISFNGHAGAIDWIASRFKQSKPATLYFDEVRTPQYTDCLNRLFSKLLAKPLPGLYHAGGPRNLSLFEIAQVVNVVGGYDPIHLKGCPRIEAGPVPPRAGNVTMDSSKLIEALGESPFDPWPLSKDLVPTHREWHCEEQRFSGSPQAVYELLYQNPSGPGDVPPSRAELWGADRFSTADDGRK
ncbi:MAG: NAD(P)-dependent oxidoreductase [Rubripirellula sp.]